MTWFKVDDGLHSHVKVRRALRRSSSSMSLWVLAGSWSADNLTDGWIPPDVCADLLPKTWRRDADILVSVGLWHLEERDGETGFIFHEWNEPGRQPKRAQVLESRAATAERQRQFRDRAKARRNAASNGGSNAVTEEPRNSVTGPLVTGVVTGAPTRPDPTPPKGGGEGLSPALPRGAAPAPPEDPPTSPPEPGDAHAGAAAVRAAIGRRAPTDPVRVDWLAELRAITPDIPPLLEAEETTHDNQTNPPT